MTKLRKNDGKDPSFQFYWKDWLADMRLMGLCKKAKGVWVDIMCISMDMPVKGVLHNGKRALSRREIVEKLTGKRRENDEGFLILVRQEILKKMPDGPLEGSFYVKRLYRDMQLREIRAAAGRKGGNPNLLKQNANQKPTPSSSSSSSSPPIAPPSSCPGDELFDRFWSAYPKKIAEDAARKAFAQRKPDEGLLAKMLTAIEAQKRTKAWQQDHGRYIPHPATWLNEGRWKDDLGPVKPASRTGGGSSKAEIENREEFLRWGRSQTTEKLTETKNQIGKVGTWMGPHHSRLIEKILAERLDESQPEQAKESKQ